MNNTELVKSSQNLMVGSDEGSQVRVILVLPPNREDTIRIWVWTFISMPFG